MSGLHYELDKAIVLGDVALQDVCAGSHHTLKALSVQLDTLEGASGNDGGSAGSVQDKGNLT